MNGQAFCNDWDGSYVNYTLIDITPQCLLNYISHLHCKLLGYCLVEICSETMNKAISNTAINMTTGAGMN